MNHSQCQNISASFPNCYTNSLLTNSQMCPAVEFAIPLEGRYNDQYVGVCVYCEFECVSSTNAVPFASVAFSQKQK